MFHKIEVKFIGQVFKVRLFFEEYEEVGLGFDNNKTWSRIIEKFPVNDGVLDIFLIKKAWADTEFELAIKIDDKYESEFKGSVKNGMSILKEKIITTPRV